MYTQRNRKKRQIIHMPNLESWEWGLKIFDGAPTTHVDHPPITQTQSINLRISGTWWYGGTGLSIQWCICYKLQQQYTYQGSFTYMREVIPKAQRSRTGVGMRQCGCMVTPPSLFFLIDLCDFGLFVCFVLSLSSILLTLLYYSYVYNCQFTWGKNGRSPRDYAILLSAYACERPARRRATIQQLVSWIRDCCYERVTSKPVARALFWECEAPQARLAGQGLLARQRRGKGCRRATGSLLMYLVDT